MYLDRVCTVARLTPNAGNSNKEQYQVVSGLEGVRMNLQPASPELTAITDGAYGKTFLAFFPIADIQIGDRVTISGTSRKLIVKGRSDWYFQPLPHLEIVLFEGDE